MKTAQENCLETFRELSRRIHHANTRGEIEALESKTEKLYDAGCLTVKQLQRLDGQIMDALARKGGA